MPPKKRRGGRQKRQEPWDECPKSDDGKFACSGGPSMKSCKGGCGQCNRHCNYRFTTQPKPAASRKPLGNVSNDMRDCSKCKQKMCENCNKCRLHCTCRRSQRNLPAPKSPAPKRSNYKEVRQKIALIVLECDADEWAAEAESDGEQSEKGSRSDCASASNDAVDTGEKNATCEL